jgi:hypothetical protein
LDELEQVRDIWRSRVHGWLDRQEAITRRETLLENPLHNNPYVGLVRGKQWRLTKISDYYCGRCGWKVTDHDSYCPECGCALHRATNRPTSQSDAPKTDETAENGATKSEMRDFDDSREKLEADVVRRFPVLYEVVMPFLDRQAAIAEREACAYCDYKHANERQARKIRDTCKALEESDRRRRELEAELDKANESGGKMFDALIDTTADRDRLLEQLNRVWLKDADGRPLHIGESRYGHDGTGWRVTGFRWGSSHPVQGVDKEGRRRDLRPEWLSSERPDSLGSLLEDVRRGALAYPRDRISGYLEDNHSIGEAVLLDVRDRIEKLAGGSE